MGKRNREHRPAASGRVSAAPWDAELAKAMEADGFAGFEEQVAESLLSELADDRSD